MTENEIFQSLKSIAPTAKVDLQEIAKTISLNANKYGIDSAKRLSAFIAQAAHETDGFRTLKEYSSGKAYEGRKDLGNIYPGDGVKFKGRGIFQTTGRTNYLSTSKHLYGDERLINNPEILEQEKPATLAAMYFWKNRNLSPLADEGNLEAITKKINGGLNGWKDRLSYYEKLKIFFSNSPFNSNSFILVLFLLLLIYFYSFHSKNIILK